MSLSPDLPETVDAATVTAPPQRLAEMVRSMTHALRADHFPTGERAQLRRLVPGQPPVLSFHRFFFEHVPEGPWRSGALEPAWVTIVASLAILAPDALVPNRGVGAALATAGFQEARLERLLAAADETQQTLALRTARYLAAQGAGCDWVDMVWLLLARNDDSTATATRRLATDYYRTLRAKEQKDKRADTP